MSKILLVEDDEQVRDMLQQVLTRANHTVRVVLDGCEALENFKDFDPDLVITDLLMPNKDGNTLIKDLKQAQPTLPVIAISGGGRADPHDYLDLSEELGATISFAKPVDNAALLMAIDLLLKDTEVVEMT